MKVVSIKTVRFASLVDEGGQPEVYLPFANPRGDRPFMRAVKEQRVLSVKQDPASQRTDFGVVGFLEEKYVTYLVFPRPLREFAGARVVGIKYDVIAQAPARAGAAAPSSRTPAGPGWSRRRKAKSERRLAPKTAPPEPPPPKPKPFTARVRISKVVTVDLHVDALTKAEAARKALDKAKDSGQLDSVEAKAKLIRITGGKSKS